jgi:hypothetical protein
MKTSILSMGIVLLASVPFAYGDSAGGRVNDPCFRVSIQNDSVNKSNVRQDCDRNVNRTVQARTVQTGEVNDNKVRQYSYDRSDYLDRLRGN